MSLRTRILTLVSAGVLVLAACSGGSHSTLPATQNQPVVPYSGPQTLSNFTWGSGAMRLAQYVGPAQGVSLSLNVQLQPQNLPGLLQYAKMASDPTSPLYRHFLTPQQIADRFGASPSAEQTAAAYFASYHLGVASWPQRLTMVVTGKQSDIEAAFGTKLGVYREYGRTFVAPMQQPHFSRQIPVAGVTGLVHVNLNRTFVLTRPGNGNYFGMSGPQLKRAFDFTGAASAGFDGTGINVGIVGTGPILTGPSGDTAVMGQLYKEKVANVSVALVSPQPASTPNKNTGTATYDPYPSGLQTPPPTTPSCVPPGGSSSNPFGDGFVSATCNPEDIEAQLDTEQIAQLAPGSNVEFYLAYNTLDCSTASPYNNPYNCPSGSTGVIGIMLNDDEIQQAIADDSVDALSISYGLDEQSASGFYFDSTGSGPGPEEFAALAAEGIAVFVASGDNGAYSCIDSNGAPTSTPCVEYPASDPSVVAVGGVNYPMDSAGNLPASAQITAWADNTTLGGDGYGDNSAGSGGGVSQFFTAPSYQSGLPASIQGTATNGKRTIPDVAMLADPLTGPAELLYGSTSGYILASGGTSASAPEMASEWAVVLQACKASSACATASGPHPWRLGNPDALLYRVYANSGQYGSTFYDVRAGSNGDQSVDPSPGAFYAGYGAGPGYDLVTGLGVPFVGHLINAVVAGQNVP